MNFVFYVTGHGFGHARRAAELLRALLKELPEGTVYVRTSAPAWPFMGLGPRVVHHLVEIDPGCAEKDLLNIDPVGTADRVAMFLRQMPDRVPGEVKFIRHHNVGHILADIAFFAGEVAEATGLPCTAISNFTWDWIYSDLFRVDPRALELVEPIRATYGKMTRLLRLPWGGVADTFPEIVHDCPLIATPSSRGRGEILAMAGLDAIDQRPKVLIAMRGGVSIDTTIAGAKGSPGLLFLHLGPPDPQFPSNVRCVSVTPGGLDFTDVLTLCDVVLSKLGYGIVADCIAARKPILWPRRNGFREDDLSAREATAFIPLQELPTDDFYAGRWGEHLEQLLCQPVPSAIGRTDGAQVCARLIAESVRR